MVRKGDTQTTEGQVVAATKRQKAEAVRLYTTTDLTADAIASRYQVSRQTLYRWIDDAGIDRRGARGPRPKDEEVSVDLSAYGRLLDELDAARRELAELRGMVQSEHDGHQRGLGQVAAAVERMAGALEAHTAMVRDLVRRVPGPTPPQQ